MRLSLIISETDLKTDWSKKENNTNINFIDDSNLMEHQRKIAIHINCFGKFC